MDQRGRNRLVWVGASILVLVVLVSSFSKSIAGFYTDLLWFRDLGHASVFWTTFWSKIATFAAFAVVAFALLYTNVRIARTMAPRALFTVAGQMPVELEEALRRLRARIDPFVGWLLLGLSLLLAAGSGRSMVHDWSLFQLALHATPFGVRDPQFGRDVAFFVFTLPALRAIVDWLLGVLAFVLFATLVVHVIDGAVRMSPGSITFAPHVKAHLSVLAGLIVLTKAADYWLRIYQLDLSPRGQVLGASYTDVHAQLPAYWILIVIALLAGVALIVNIRFKGWRLPVIALGTWIAAAVLVGSVYPALVQQFRVAPNEASSEAPYIERNIVSTRKAFALESIDAQPFSADESLTATELKADNATIDNVRLWDPKYVAQAYRQLQEIRSYYVFNDVDIDRYPLSGQTREVLISARELDVSKLPDRSQTWQNQHLSYTHGYGVVVSPVRESNSQGRPNFLVRDIPPTGDSDLEITRPGVYFGEMTQNYVLVDTKATEFDYPKGAENARTSYEGAAGVKIGGLLGRVAFWLRFSDSQLLFSDYIRPDSKVLFRRTITERLGALAPWLQLDGDPYITIQDGKLVWIVDGYTTSDWYPYSEPHEGVNYIRNSVKVTIDAYDGTVKLYAFDPSDPVLASWRKVFPGLVVDASTMPQGIRAHLRYPEGLFRVQAEAYKTYHMSDPAVFYNKEDQWELPGETGGVQMQPYYVLMRLPRQPKESFLLMEPFTPRGRDNMIAWMAAKSDPGEYGQRIVYGFPKQKLVAGPNQVVAAVNQDPTISSQLTLWRQGGSDAELGNMLVLPVNESILYVQPLYLLASNAPIPQLTRVIVSFGDKVAMEPDLASALAKIFGESAGEVVTSERPSGQATSTPTPSGPTGSQLQQARTLYDRALQAQRRGDWAEYGRLIGELGRVLSRAASSSQEASQAR